MKKVILLSTTLLILFISCQTTEYETIIKDNDFRSTINTGKFIEFENGFTRKGPNDKRDSSFQ